MRGQRAEQQMIGQPLAYAAARLWPEAGGLVTAATVYEDYAAWCVRDDRLALREGVFREALLSIARFSGVPVHIDGTSIVYGDVRLGASTPAKA